MQSIHADETEKSQVPYSHNAVRVTEVMLVAVRFRTSLFSYQAF
jgi:hypothetical protein